jgi:ABC-type branched-subunit amino acid transport system substrate-binding protein
VLPLPDCPTEWSDTGGIDDETITIGMTLPESGPVASLSLVDDGIQAWFDEVNETDPIDGKQVQIVKRDDAFDPARTLSGVEEMIETEEPFAIAFLIGTANNLAVRDLLDEVCIPQLLNATGFPAWGDPENYPWTIGGLLAYDTEARMWCNDIVDQVGEGASVAGLFMDNDFGQSYLDEMEACADDGLIDLVETVRHDPAAPDVTDEMTTLAATDADALVLGTTGAPCSQSMAALDQSGWEPRTYLHGGCQTISTYFTPIDPAGEGVIVAQTQREISAQGDPAVDHAIEVMEAAGLDPFSGAGYSGIIAGSVFEPILRAAAEMDGGLTRTNLMRAVWNMDFEHPLGVPGARLRTDGANDAYVIEAAQLGQYVPPAAGETAGHYEPVGDVLDLEGETGVYEGD